MNAATVAAMLVSSRTVCSRSLTSRRCENAQPIHPANEPAQRLLSWPSNYKLPSLVHVPGVPATVQTHDFGLPALGAEL